ncbi:MAG: endonuclease/exonuclease/phosphatase family protein [Bacteroidaceae bacterium]
MKKASFILLLLWTVGTAWGKSNKEFTVLQWNIWQEGTSVKGGYEAIVNELERLQPDFVTFSEVRNYKQTNFIARLISSLKARGLSYYGFYSYDTGLLSKHPLTDSTAVYPEKNDHGSIYRLTSEIHGRKIAVYTAHLDYLNDAYYEVRGYDGNSWKEIPIPTRVDEVLRRNALSFRDEEMNTFLLAARQDTKEGTIVVLGGDFNEPSHLDWTEETKNVRDHHGFVIPWPQTLALEEEGFIDAYRKLYPNPLTHPGITFPTDNEHVTVERLTWAPLADERDRIDYIFYKGKGIEVKSCAIFGPEGTIAYGQRKPNTHSDRFLKPLGVWPTDHKGLFCTFRLR